MKQPLLVAVLAILFPLHFFAQPFSLGTNNVNGSPFSCVNLDDRGTYKRIILQANQSSSSATWEFPQTCSFPGDVWRPYGGGTAAIPFNVIIPPVAGTGSALYNSGNGGASGNLSPVTNGRFYTFNIQNVASGTNAYMGVMETNQAPVDIQSVSQNAGVNGISPFTAVQLTVTTSATPTERVFVRYTTNNFTSSSLEEFSFTGSTGTATIPAQTLGTVVRYYVYSSTKSKALINTEVLSHGQLVHDMSTLQWNNNGGTNYSYTVTTGTVLVNATNTVNDTYYSTLRGAVDAVNAGTHTGQINVTILGNTTETSSCVLNASGVGLANYTTWRIAPAGFVPRSITGSIDGALIDLDGADGVTIDGIDASGNTLTLSNLSTATTASTIRLINDAQSNSIRNCIVLGASSANTTGTILLGGSAVSPGGNNNNLIRNCLIASNGSGFPTVGVASLGTAAPDQVNRNNSIDSCRIADFFNAGVTNYGIQIGSGNGTWSITKNKLYQTNARTFTTANTHRGISVTAGSGHIIRGNRIGFADADGNGTYTMSSTIATRFIGLEISTVASADTVFVDDNTVAGISLSSSSGATTSNGVLCGISVTGGNVVMGSQVGNTIGRATGINSMTITSTTAGALLVGIHVGTTGAVRILRSQLGAFSSSGVTASVSGSVVGINVTAASSYLQLDSNTIGNTTADNMRGGTVTLTTGNSLVTGITLNTLPVVGVVTRNTIQQLTSYGTGTSGAARGFTTQANTGSSSTVTVSRNIIRQITSNAATGSIANGLASVLGIQIGAGNNCVISQNAISQLSNTNAGAVPTFVVGVGVGNATNTVVSENTIFDLSNASTSVSTTAPGVAAGVLVRSGTTTVTVVNNMIALGAAKTTNTCFVGIQANFGSTPDPTTRIYHNTVHISGTATSGAQPSFSFARTDFSALARTVPVVLLNNIFTNSRSGGTGLHLAIANNYGAATSSATGWSSDYNVLNAGGAAMGWWTSARNFSDWKTASSGDATSYSGVTVTYVNEANDLHLNMGTNANPMESSGQSIPSVLSDIDGDVRPGPTGSVNGGGVRSDLGSDEFDGVGIDNSAPLITLSSVSFTCSTGDRVLTAQIGDLSGVPASGSFVPRLYYRKNGGSYQSTPGVLQSGTNLIGTWAFTVSASALGGLTAGDQVFYFVAAQDQRSPTALLAASPSTDFVGVDVNTITTPPSNPASYAISPTLQGTYTVGLGGQFTTLTQAVNQYNTACLGGQVVFELLDNTYPSETYPIVIQANADASSSNRLVIRPSATALPVFSGDAPTSLLQINGGDYIDIQGNAGSLVPSPCAVLPTRNMQWINTNTSANSAVVAVQTTIDGNPSTFVRLMNLGVVGGSNTVTTVGVHIGGTTVNSGVGANGNSDIEVLNCSIQKVGYGIYASGSTALNKDRRISIKQNTMYAFGADAIGRFGVLALFEDSIRIERNQIGGITNTTGDIAAIALGSSLIASNISTGSEVSNSTIAFNQIDSVQLAGSNSAVGILIGPAQTGVTLVYNNVVNRVIASATSSDIGAGVLVVGNGTASVRIWHNSIRMNGPIGTGATQPLMGVGVFSALTPIEIRNNIVSVTGTTGANLNVALGVGYTATTGNYANLTSSNNILHVTGTGSAIGRTGGLGSGGTARVSLADWQTETGDELNSQATQPFFQSDADLHLDGTQVGNATIDRSGLALAAVTTDIDCQDRSLLAPDPGADEFYAVCGVSQLAATAGGGSVCQTDVVEVTDRYTTSGGCGLIARIERSGATPVSGNIQACVTIDATVQVYNGDPYVQRHYDFVPQRNPTSSTATLTLYATQAEFNAYNAANGAYPDLPTGPADAAGIANLRVTQFGGTGTAPGNYTGGATLINPTDTDISWDAVNGWWSIRFSITGFSGFYIHTTPTGGPLPVRIVRFEGRKQNLATDLQWQVACSGTPRVTLTIERQDAGSANSFTPVYSVVADEARCRTPFNWSDTRPHQRAVFYRLKVDDGLRIQYSNILRFSEHPVTGIRLWPNRITANQPVTLEYVSPQQGIARFELLDGAGRLVWKNQQSVGVGVQRQLLVLPDLPAGWYNLRTWINQQILDKPIPLIRE